MPTLQDVPLRLRTLGAVLAAGRGRPPAGELPSESACTVHPAAAPGNGTAKHRGAVTAD